MPLPLRGRGVVNRSDLAQGIINPMTAAFGVQAKGGRKERRAHGFSPPNNTPKEKKRKKFEHPPNPVVYVSMNNFAGCIEGATVNTGASDLKSRTIAGQRSNTGATAWWTPWSGGLQGLFARVELKSTPHWSRNHGNPCAEKWMHTRPQQIFSSRSRMGKRESDAHVRGAAVAQRLHSAIFGSGELPTENAELQRLGGR